MSLTLRAITEADADFLFVMRNDPLTCAMSEHQRVVTPDEHSRWLMRMLSPVMQSIYKTHIFVAEYNGRPVGTGQIRLSRSRSSSESHDGEESRACVLSYTIHPQHRWLGMGTALVTELVKVAKDVPYDVTVCRIRRVNLASLKCAVRGGVDRIELF